MILWFHHFGTRSPNLFCWLRHHLRCSWPFFLPSSLHHRLQPNQQHRIEQRSSWTSTTPPNFLFCFVLVLIWGCFREVAMSQMQFREEPDDLTGIPEGVTTLLAGKYATIEPSDGTAHKPSPPPGTTQQKYHTGDGECNLFGLIYCSSLEKQM